MYLFILFVVLATPVAFTMYWIGRGYNLDSALANWRAANEIADDDVPDGTLVNAKTGEVVEPGSRRYNKVLKKSGVRFE